MNTRHDNDDQTTIERKTTRAPRVFAYTRTFEETEPTNEQRERIAGWAARQNIAVTSWDHDTVLGRATWQSRKIANALKESRAGDTIVVSELSRVANSSTGLLLYIIKCIEKKVTFVAVSQNVIVDQSWTSTTAVPALRLAIRIDCALLKERTTRAAALRKSKGLTHSEPYEHPTKSKLDRNRPEIERLLAAGVAERALARLFNCAANTMNRYVRAIKLDPTPNPKLPLPHMDTVSDPPPT